jgi:hypothetical protein
MKLLHFATTSAMKLEHRVFCMDGAVGLINCDIDELQYSKVSLTMSTLQ